MNYSTSNLFNMPIKISWKLAVLSAIALTGIIFVFLQAPIPQSQEYHHFADDRELFGIPNFWNVISNLPFIITGLWGILFLLGQKTNNRPDTAKFVFFSGILLTAFGSVWYHLHPDNQTMVWDRLPMTIAFMAFFSIIISECIDEQTGRKLLFALLFLGLLSVCYWQLTESRGHGDLRFYFLVQFLPMVLIPLMLLLFKPKEIPALCFWLVLLAYVVAKVFETADVEVYTSTGSISGHSVKHVIAAVAPFIFLLGLKRVRFKKGNVLT